MAEQVTLDQVKGALEQYKTDIKAEMDGLKQNVNSDNEAKITALTAKLTEVESALTGVTDQLKEMKSKGFGLPGAKEDLDHGTVKFSWQKFFLAMRLGQLHMRGAGGLSPDKAWDKIAPAERDLCSAYMERRNKEFQDAIAYLPGVAAKDYEVDDGSSGGFLVPPEVYSGDIIETTYAQTPILNMPTMKLTGLRGDLPIPVDNANLTAYWLGENEKPTKSTTSFKLQWLRAKKLGVFTKISNRLIAFSNQAIETIIKEKMSRDASIELSRGLTLGSGSDSEPQGLMESKNLAGMLSAGNCGTNGGKFLIDHLAKMKQTLASNNELRDTNSYGCLMRPEVYFGMLRERITQFSTQSRGRGAPIIGGTLMLDGAAISNAVGMQLGHTTQLSGTETQGSRSTCSTVVGGDFSKFVYASFRDPIFRVSDIAGDGSTGSAFLDDQLYLVMFIECDSRLLRKTTFAKVTGADVSEATW